MDGSGTLLQKERATPAVLAFLRETTIGDMVSLAALGRGRGADGMAGDGRRGGRVGDETFLYLPFVGVYRSFVFSFRLSFATLLW